MDAGRQAALGLLTFAALVCAWTIGGCGSSSPAPTPDPASASTPVAPRLAPTVPATENNQLEQSADTVSLIQLVDPLDEPEFYCVDVPGFGSGVSLLSALVVHTCKLTGAEDEMFTIDRGSAGHLYMEEYDLCVEAEGSATGSRLYLKACSDLPLQRFELAQDATFRLLHGGPQDLCLAVAPGEGQPTGGPSHLRRDLMLQECAMTEAVLSRWQLPGSAPE